jgi:hypothetical protein
LHCCDAVVLRRTVTDGRAGSQFVNSEVKPIDECLRVVNSCRAEWESALLSLCCVLWHLCCVSLTSVASNPLRGPAASLSKFLRAKKASVEATGLDCVVALSKLEVRWCDRGAFSRVLPSRSVLDRVLPTRLLDSTWSRG